MTSDNKLWASSFILPELREGFQRLAEAKLKVEKPQLDAQQIEDMEVTVAQSMEVGADLSFELYDDGYIREVIGAVHYVDHLRKEFRVKDARGDTNFVRFADIINVKNAPSG
ncbi:YolD-like family protein [Bacillus amyloliquefaciens]|uniref:YolD-like family protein n=1 Tax=Bacillus amyloliquefaciens TaxID=1390 RepID=UPI0011CA2954|nr:YolD-like family protein [Bacillus amyloliquefaciens]TXK24573.1 YolD-like family protein [Bacillus amyloliquefaciens]TXK30788.1 YolD-like family protein [Bacillus amyloliquefaciens]TXK69989.1 YolD-like family protein [Bacillus amyloliquefaciens]